MGFHGGSEVKTSACNVGDLGSIPGSGRSPGEGNGNPLQYSCLENPMDRGAWWATVHGITNVTTSLMGYLLLNWSFDNFYFLTRFSSAYIVIFLIISLLLFINTKSPKISSWFVRRP